MPTPEFEDTRYGADADEPLFADRYRILDRIGQGRLGEIFAARDESFKDMGVVQPLAIQIVPESIIRNNKLFNSLNVGYAQLRDSNHPNIVNVKRFGRTGKSGYLAMELLEGASTRVTLDAAVTLTLAEVRAVIHGVGAALHFLHTKDIVHGNLTTRNAFVTHNLEVRLLDVIPVDPAEAIVRKVATGDNLSPYTAADDVFGLACLTYELLSGKPPFDSRYRPIARQEGRNAERITTLPDREWEALHLALSMDEQRVSSVASFLNALGVQGAERLQSPLGQRPMALEIETTIPMADVTDADPVPVDETGPSNFHPRKEASRLRTIILGTLLTCLGAWSYFGQPKERAIEWIGYVDARLDLGIAEPSNQRGEVPVNDVAPLNSPADTAEQSPARVTPQVQATQPSEPVETNVSVKPSETAIVEPLTVTVSKKSESALDEPAVPSISAAAATPTFVVSERVVTASEGDGAARITMPSVAGLQGPPIWWTTDQTAEADSDYIAVEQTTLAEKLSDEGRTLFIPLINDSVFEQRESFFVSIGHLTEPQGQIERIAIVRVDIVDDDFPSGR